MIDPVKENSPNASGNSSDPEERDASDSPVGIGLTSHEPVLCGVWSAILAETNLAYHNPTC